MPGHILELRPNTVPNAPRPYRQKTTDAIHHGYDIFAPVGTPVVAPSIGWVIRTASGFTWDDFDRLIEGPALDSHTRAKNLDVYR